jgi:hypothetical protein
MDLSDPEGQDSADLAGIYQCMSCEQIFLLLRAQRQMPVAMGLLVQKQGPNPIRSRSALYEQIVDVYTRILLQHFY